MISRYGIQNQPHAKASPEVPACLEKYAQAQRYTNQAQKVYPEKIQRHHWTDIAKIKTKQFQKALASFNR